MKNNKIYCISYASNFFTGRIKGFVNEIKTFNLFDDFKVYTPEDLSFNFLNKFDQVMKLPRGGGYWIWKPYIIKQYMESMNEGDVLFYTDIGCSFNKTPESEKTFNFYLDNIAENNFLRFVSNYKELEFTNSKTIDFFSNKYNIKFNKLANSKHLIASIMGFKKCKHTVMFLDEIMNCLEEDCNIITDEYNNMNKNPNFKDHRHDQSLFSLLYKSLNYTLAFEDTTWSTDFTTCTNIPILTTRKKN